MNNILKISKLIINFENKVKSNSYRLYKKALIPDEIQDIPGVEPPDTSRFKEIYDHLKRALQNKDNATIVAATHAVLALLSLYPGLAWLDVVNAIIFLVEEKPIEAAICLLSIIVPGLDEYIVVKNSVVIIKNASLARKFILQNKEMIAKVIAKVSTVAGWEVLSQVTADSVENYVASNE